MTTMHSHRRLDVAGFLLLLLGVVCGVLAYWLITVHDMNPLILVPSVVAATTGASHVTKREASRS